MKTLIKNYKTPKVDKSVLQNALLIHSRKESKVKILSYTFLIVIFLIFMQNLIQLNLSNIDIFVSVIGNVNVLLILFINLLVGITYFIFQSPLLILSTFFLYYISRMYYYSKVKI